MIKNNPKCYDLVIKYFNFLISCFYRRVRIVGLVRTLGKRVSVKGSRVRIPYSPPSFAKASDGRPSAKELSTSFQGYKVQCGERCRSELYKSKQNKFPIKINIITDLNSLPKKRSGAALNDI